jgi:hypothetical protein
MEKLMTTTTLAPTPDLPALGHDLVDSWGLDSFPASDPPSNW